MPVVSGSLTDIGLEPLTGLSPLLRFSPSADGAVDGDGRVFASLPVDVVPGADGSFSVDLASTTGVLPRGTYWRLSVHFFGRTADSETFPASDYPTHKLFVPAEGGRIADLLDLPAHSDMAWVGIDPPPESRGYLFWIDISGETPVLKGWQ